MQPFRPLSLTRPLTLGLAGALFAAAPATAQDETLPELPPAPSFGQPMSAQEIESLPPQYRALPATSETTTTTIGADGVETVTRTRRITATGPVSYQQTQYPLTQYQQGEYTQAGQAAYGYAPYAYAAAPVVFDRAQWLAECRSRTEGLSDKQRGRIIGALIGAVGGALVGDAIAGNGDELAGALLGAGAGAAAGALAGDAIDDRRERDDYECEDVLARYLAQPSVVYAGPTRIAARTIPAPAYGYQGYAPQAYGYSYGYAPAYPAYEYGYVQQQTVLVPVQTMQQQRVLVRETVREEMVPAARSIPRPVADPVRLPAPTPIKGGEPRMIKN